MLGMTYTDVPVAQATTVRQNPSPKTHLETACEQIGQFSMSPTTVVGSSQTYSMNPLTLAGTRLNTLARNYQKYRFRKLAMTVQSSASTATGGLYVVGYNSNPDAELAAGYQAVQQVSALPGSISANAWRTVTVHARLEDPRKWYNLDADSDELMQVAQGYFAIVAQVPASSTGPTSYAVWLDYTVEFTGAAINQVPTVVGLMPAFTATVDPPGTRTATLVAEPGEPPFPAALAIGVEYSINPPYQLTLSDGTDALCNALFQPINGRFAFYKSVEDIQGNSPLAISATFSVPRTIISTVP